MEQQDNVRDEWTSGYTSWTVGLLSRPAKATFGQSNVLTIALSMYIGNFGWLRPSPNINTLDVSPMLHLHRKPPVHVE